MSRNVTAATTLGSKFAVGEIADFVGVPNYYDAGDSKWLRTGTWVSANLVPTAVVNTLKDTGSLSVALSNNSLIDDNYSCINGMLPAAIVGSTRCFSYSSNLKGNAAHAFVVNTDGAQVINIGQTTNYSQISTGAGNCITSDGTKFWSWTAASASAFGVKSSTNAVTWSAETLSGLPTFAGLVSAQICGTSNVESSYPMGDKFMAVTGQNLIAAWCGARHLLIGLNASGQYLATLSSNGTAFGGDQSVAVLGGDTIRASMTTWFNRNGNNFFWTSGNSARFSADGGATWSASTNAPVETSYYRVNATDQARIMAFTQGSTAVKVTTNSGQTWASVTLPLSALEASAYTCGRGSTWAFAQAGSCYKTVDDGANWSVVIAPTGFGAISAIYADANRWYLFSAVSNQIAVSTDLITWTIRNISTPSTGVGGIPTNFVSTDANIVVGCYSGNLLYTTDGGVTWYWSYATNAVTATAASLTKIIANTVGTPMILSATTVDSNSHRSAYVPITALSSNPVAVRSTATAVTPLRTNALAFSRVA